MTADAHSAESARTRVRRRDVYLAAGVLAAAVLVLGWAGMSLSVVRPDRACASCHSQAKTALGKDAHATLGCYDCHAEPSAAARALRVLDDVGDVFSFADASTAEAHISSSACLRCHAEVLRRVVERTGIRMSHETCLASSSECTDCHADTGHDLVAPGRIVTMDACSRCHDGDEATKDCEACHVDKSTRRDRLNAWVVTHGKNWQQTHGMGNLETCAVCHDRQKCSKCHLPVPHGKGWPRTHGTTVIDKGISACTNCHVKQLCDGCHGLPMPHPKKWLPEHSGSVEKSQIPKKCHSCHSEDDCVQCHLMHTHPGISPERLRELGVR